ncbi:hypothetical protein L596_020388 [Steinernema carpocapsae]|uniref:Protein kinase domain-containing protein n=1 Tax=Steinernema carpocapsae TaxID=34508 RepID=A0A4U5MTG2_STECR|nr:hypothetical protein L596_020388 [Steinernema carpocapsae]
MLSGNSNVELKFGKVVGKHWKVCSRLGSGGCGAVFLVEDINTRAKAALKAESHNIPGGGVLKLEVQILRRLEGRKHVPQLLRAGKKEAYSYMVMTLLGDNIEKLFRLCRKQFSISTQVRLGIHILFALKQLHEVGFLHRDVKPANLALGIGEHDSRVVYLLDFGLAREFIYSGDGRVELRRERFRVHFRGTVRYCSARTHQRKEQGRCDDLWSLFYVVAEFRGPLPWASTSNRNEVASLKETMPDVRLLSRSPSQLLDIPTHLRELGYYDRPDYLRIYHAFEAVLEAQRIRFYDPYDWELEPSYKRTVPNTSVRTIESTSTDRPFDSNRQKGSDRSIRPNSLESPTTESKEDVAGYKIDDFKRNELGF